MSAFDAFNSVQDHVMHTARAHIDRTVLEAFIAGIDSCEDPGARHILELLCDLYALSVIEADKAFLEHRLLSTERARAVNNGINERCRNLRPHAETLVDAFGIPEQLRDAEMLHPERLPTPERDAAVNIAEETIDWLREEQLQIDEQWSICSRPDSHGGPTSTRRPLNSWRGDRPQRRTRIPAGRPDRVASRGGSHRDRTGDHQPLPMRAASMAGPVYDVSARMLDLWSLVRVTDDNGGWMRYLLAAAAVMQIAEARLLAPTLAEAVGAVPATSAHPESGTRSVPGEMAFAAAAFAASGDQPSRGRKPSSSMPSAVLPEPATGGRRQRRGPGSGH